MDMNAWLLLAVFTIGLVSIIGFFVKMKNGFGPFNTSALLLLLIVIVTSLLFITSKFEGQYLANIMFAVIGFSGGLFTKIRSDDGKDESATEKETPNPQSRGTK